MDLAHGKLTPDFTFRYFAGGGMTCVSHDIPVGVYDLLCFLLCFFPGVFFISRVTGACPASSPVAKDLIMGVNGRTTRIYMVYIIKIKIHSSCDIRRFCRNSSLQAVRDTPIARITGCVSSLRI